MSPAPSIDLSIHLPSGTPRTYGPRTSLKNSVASSAVSSSAATSSSPPPTFRVASPAARRFRTQLTSPNVPMIQRRPFTSTSATGVVRPKGHTGVEQALGQWIEESDDAGNTNGSGCGGSHGGALLVINQLIEYEYTDTVNQLLEAAAAGLRPRKRSSCRRARSACGE